MSDKITEAVDSLTEMPRGKKLNSQSGMDVIVDAGTLKTLIKAAEESLSLAAQRYSVAHVRQRPSTEYTQSAIDDARDSLERGV